MTKIMNEDFLDVLQDKGPATIVSINGNPASVVNTWSQYINVVSDDIILIPAAGCTRLNKILKKIQKHELIITIGSYNYSGTAGMGRGYHIHGSGQFINEGAYFDQNESPI
ncbi:pyridoxamine 5'-phosphate oxidase family protein [Lactiplantibacillus plantarum]|uniref:pyridoxamine 5'-phosphate oxidase family protein n=1 Tax=Lactiplantibacillus plantarum TaxID=1590 RepID=UPI000B32CDC0|nr:pyridoxamine 5'-phosphate oxidase family protein [Lactiplantibacillus plantarum]